MRGLVCISVALLFGGAALAQSKDALFDDAEEAGEVKLLSPKQAQTRAFGSVAFDYARVVADPQHTAHIRLRTTVGAQGGDQGLKWKLSGRVDGDAAYIGADNFYRAEVKNNQKLGAELLENYVDFRAAGLDVRAGKQNVIWGEMVGFYVADVVTPRDMRDFVQVNTEYMRQTQWALRVEKFSGDWHNEFVWIPVQTYDKIGEPGADFYPYPAPVTPGYAFVVNGEQFPDKTLSNSSVGLRTGVLKNGWDLSAFAYYSRDRAASFERQIVNGPTPTMVYTPVHDRIRQVGGTLAKDLDGMVFKTELVWTGGQRYTVTSLDSSNGLASSHSINLAFGLDTSPLQDLKVNYQLFAQNLSSWQNSMLVDRLETGGSVMLNYQFSRNVGGQLLWATSFNRADGWVNPVLNWKLRPDTQLSLGLDYYYGPDTGRFGRYDSQDRVWGAVRQSF